MKKVIPPVVNMTAPTKNEKTLKNRTGERMWPLSEMSLPAATFWADVSNIVIAVSLAVGLVATLASMNLSNVKERHWDNAREKSQERIAELSADAEGSRAAIAGANERAAIAAQSAAEANERAAELQAENLALQAALAPRNAGILAVSGPAKANEWFAGLEAFSDTQVLIQAVSDDREANNLAFGIGLALSARGWKSSLITEKRSNLAPGHIREGVSVLYPVKIHGL